MELKYHEEISRNVLANHRFGPGSQAIVLWGNWSADIWTLWPFSNTIHGRRSQLLHFLELPTPEAVAGRWLWLERESARTLSARRSPHTALYQIGQYLHAVQDFYSHTNWVDLCLAAGVAPGAVPTWEEGLPAGARLDDLISAYYPDSSAPHTEWGHSYVHKDHPWCSAGPVAFEAAIKVAARATARWLPRLIASVSPELRPKLTKLTHAPLPTRALLKSLRWTDRVGIPRWIGGQSAPPRGAV